MLENSKKFYSREFKVEAVKLISYLITMKVVKSFGGTRVKRANMP